MEWLVGATELVGGIASAASGAFITWYYRGSPPTTKHVIYIPVVALLLIVVGIGLAGRGAGLI